ncbi:hypothetical protein [Moorena sp. SIO3I6]|uniref:nSTAND1 domain-containing NTPase n=1 Tax=Moorena sp. SIO3I6 TaxID=2607831 RepID=UPI0013F8F01F|nr:hypothetical protein [Moorena sp. SIO3I6]NEP21931.1 hypothetical protein [Moorena sp. SIO3I6]
MSDSNDIHQDIRDPKNAAIAATGNAVVYNYYYYYYRSNNVDDRPVDDDETVTNENLSCPYRGLYNFAPDDDKFFFGRDVFIEKLFQETQTRSFIPVLGPSGSGKSSVVLAGLVPKLFKEQGNWKFTHFRPSSANDPFYALAEALVPLYMSELDSTDEMTQASKLAESLKAKSLSGNEEELSLAKVYSKIQRKHPNHKILLIADQFEELYTEYSDPELRRRFLDCLLASLPSSSQASSSIVLVATMRADFLDNALSYRPFADVLQNADVKLGPMNREELEEVIVKPTKTLGEDITFQAGLVERILNDVEDEAGNLPLLEFALEKLWEKREGKQLTHKAYKEIGGVKGALSKHASKKYNELTPTEQKLAKQIFIQLVQPGKGTKDTRRLATKTDLGDAKWSLVNKLANRDHRLVVTSRRAVASQDTDNQKKSPRQNLATDIPPDKGDKVESDVVEVAHEALIENWEVLEEWIRESREFRIWQERLQASLDQWEETKEDPGSLLKGKFLNKAEYYLKQRAYDFTEPQKDYIKKSQKARQKSIIKTTVFATANVLLILTIIGIAWDRYNLASQKAGIRNLSGNGVVEPKDIRAAQSILQDAERASKNNVRNALADYRQVSLYTNLLEKRLNNQDNQDDTITLSQEEIKKLENISKQAKAGLYKLIEAERLPELEEQLKADNRIGERISRTTSKREERFSPGALQTTYKILHDDFGVGADLDGSGDLHSQTEAELIPCPLLQKIEELWRQETDCGWYHDPHQDVWKRTFIYYDPNCKVLQEAKEGVTLTKHVFEGRIEYARNRIKFCVIKPKQFNQDL